MKLSFGMQCDVEITFSFSSLDKAEAFDSRWVNPENLCAQKGSKVEGGVGPFGLLTLASEKLHEFTPVFFRIFKAPNKHVVLMCSDARRLVFHYIPICFFSCFLITSFCTSFTVPL